MKIVEDMLTPPLCGRGAGGEVKESDQKNIQDENQKNDHYT